MDLTLYLLQGFEVLKNTTITISGYSAIDAIFDHNTLGHEKQLNFLEDEEIPIKVRTGDLPVPHKIIIGKKVVLELDGNVYRIDRISPGSATAFVYLNSKDRA